KKGEVIFREGDEGDVLYVIRKGSVKISRKNSAGVDVAQTYIPAGNYVGEMALLKEEPDFRSATVTAAVACEMLILEKGDFRDLLRSNPKVRERIEQLARERAVENITEELDQGTGNLLDFVVSEGVTDAENVLVINSDLCVGCDNCERACAATHGGYSRLDRKGGKSLASIQVPISCRHCENPLCMTDCPPDALMRKPDGEVIIQDCCIGCGNCVNNCPYGVIQMVYENPNHKAFSLLELLGLASKRKAPKKGQAKAGKCDLCSTLEGGPACVRACPTGAAMRINPSQLVELVGRKQGASV
ncbi:MAG: cyclic nucleotide-binding domain-containing protein, partial [Bdellovibrionales bacterium]|nr:cyclic nucleotide-binding domain-containing protein [Bdellovibrionales bacterium]